MNTMNDGAAPTRESGSASQSNGTPSGPHSTPSHERPDDRPKEERIAELLEESSRDDRPRGVDKTAAELDDDAAYEAALEEARREEDGEELEVREEGKVLSHKERLEALIAENKAEAYDAAIFNTGDGEPVTLGALKDAWQERQTAEREIVQKSAALDARESEIVAHQTLISEMGDAIESHIPPELVNQYAQRMQDEVQRERRKALAVMPELADPTIYEAFRGDVAEYCKDFGYRPEELVIKDHRMLRVLKQAMSDRKRLKKLLDFKPSERPPASVKTGGRSDKGGEAQQLVDRAKRTGMQSDKLRAIGKLIGG